MHLKKNNTMTVKNICILVRDCCISIHFGDDVDKGDVSDAGTNKPNEQNSTAAHLQRKFLVI